MRSPFRITTVADWANDQLGADKGKGGKYLILPPGYKEKAPEGYFVMQSETNRGFVNHDAHLGGAIFGLLFVAATDPSAYGRALEMLRE